MGRTSEKEVVKLFQTQPLELIVFLLAYMITSGFLVVVVFVFFSE